MSRDILINPHRGSTGSNVFPEIQFNGLSASSIKLKVDDDGSVVYTGTYGVLFNVSDNKDGLLHSVNDVSGLPILSVYSYDYVQMGRWDKNALIVNYDNVGVGLTAPSTKFHVYSTQSGAFRLQDTSEGLNKVLTSDVNGVATWATVSVASGNGVTASGTTNYVSKFTGTNTLGNSIIYDSGINVGIGTASPTARLHIKASDSSSGTYSLKIENGSNGNILSIVNDGTSQFGTGLKILPGGNAVSVSGSFPVYGGFGNSFEAGLIGLTSDMSIGGAINFNLSGNSRIYGDGSFGIIYSSLAGSTTHQFVGKVGIGTASATAKLHVQGSDSSSGTYSLKVQNSSFVDLFSVRNDGYVAIGLATASATLHVKGATSGATGSTIFKVDGNVGELFTINDSLTGSLFSVNDISGLPIIEAFSDSTIIMGDYSAPSLYTTKKVTANTGTTDIYSIATASYTGAYYDYTISDGSNARSGKITAVWLGPTVSYTETSTLDIGTTSNFTFSVVSSGTYSVLRTSASSNGWTVKTIIRSI